MIKKIVFSAIIAALYSTLTLLLAPIGYGVLQFRISEALTLLPLIFPESIIGLYIGCIISNLLSLYGIPDVVFGSLATLIAGLITYLIGKKIKNTKLKLFLGGLPPILLNAFVIPLIVLLTTEENISYFLSVGEMIISQSLAIYLLGIPLYFAMNKFLIRFNSSNHSAVSVLNNNSSENEVLLKSETKNTNININVKETESINIAVDTINQSDKNKT